MTSPIGARLLRAALLALAATGCLSSVAPVASKFCKGQLIVANQGGTVTVTAQDCPALAGTSVVVPPHALAQDTIVTITPGPATLALSGATAVGPVVDLGPSGAHFSYAATVTLPLDLSMVPEPYRLFVQVVEASGATRRIVHRDLDTGPAAGTLSFQIRDFTEFEVGIDDSPCSYCPLGDVCDPITGDCVCGIGPCGGACCTSAQTCVDGACCGTAEVCGNACCVSGTNTCVNGACCPNAQACGTTCCAAMDTCVNGACCPNAQACGATCCIATDTCVNGACCPNYQACGTRCCGPAGTCVDGACCPAAQACGTTCCTAGTVCAQDRVPEYCAVPCAQPSDCGGATPCCRPMSDSFDNLLQTGVCEPNPGARSSYSCICTTSSECASGCCAPLAANLKNRPEGPYACKPNDGAHYDCCFGTVSCRDANECCLADSAGNQFCATPCTDGTECPGTHCHTYDNSHSSCSGNQGCGP